MDASSSPEPYTLSLHDALPIFDVLDDLADALEVTAQHRLERLPVAAPGEALQPPTKVPNATDETDDRDRKSTRLNSSHSQISYAVFCLKKKTAHSSRVHALWRP